MMFKQKTALFVVSIIVTAVQTIAIDDLVAWP